MSGETGLNMQFSGVTGPFLSADYQEMIITYKGFLSNTADLSNPYVSLTGSTYAIGADGTPRYMTPSTYTGMVAPVNFSTTGVVNAFNWKVKEDVGTSFYNNTVYLHFAPGATGVQWATPGTTTVSFSRSQTPSTTTSSQQAFPRDYSGQSSQDVKRNAPRAQ